MYANTCRFCNYLCILYTETAYHVYTMFSCNLHVITTTLMADTALEAIGHTPHHLSESVGTTGVVCNCSVCECVCVSPNIYSMQHPPLSSCVLSSVFFLRLTASSARCTTTHTHTHTHTHKVLTSKVNHTNTPLPGYMLMLLSCVIIISPSSANTFQQNTTAS